MGRSEKGHKQTEALKLHCMTVERSACPDSVVILDRQVLAEALKENRTLKRLNLAGNGIGIGMNVVKARHGHWVAGVC